MRWRKNRKLSISYIIAILSLIPLDLFFLTSNISWAGIPMIYLLRLNRILRFKRIFELLGKWSRLTSISVGYFRLTKILFTIFLSNHIIACLWFLLPKLEGFPANSWVITSGIEQLTPILQYQRALYWAITTMTTVGYGDITPSRTYEYTFVMITMVLGASFYASIIGGFASIITNLDSSKANFKKRMDIIGQFLNRRRIPLKMKERVKSYYDYLWKKQGDIQTLSFLEDLPKSFRIDLLNDLIGPMLLKTPLFANCSDRLKKELIFLLQPAIYDPGCSIVEPGDMGDGIYFVTSGSATIEKENGELFCKIKEGEYFGDFSLMLSEPRSGRVRANQFCEVFILSSENYSYLKKKDPEFNDVLKNIAKKRREMVSNLIMEGIIL